MKRTIALMSIFVLALLGCASQAEPTAIPVNQTSAPAAPQNQPTAALPAASKCQSKLIGKVTDAGGALVQGAVVEIKAASFNAKTLTDANGLYGFAGLCAGQYTFSVTLPGQSAKGVPDTASVDGANTAKADLAVK